MRTRRLITAWILTLSVLFLTGCLTARIPEDETMESTQERVTEVPQTKESETDAPVTDAPSESEASETAASEPAESVTPPVSEPTTETPTEPRIPEGMSVFFGHLMDHAVAEANERTLAQQGSGLYDVLSEHVWLNEEVLPLIEAYTLPERPFYGARAVTPELREQILANRNTAFLSEFPGTEVQLRYGIISRNAAVRSFPTSMRAADSLDGRAFDYFQESMFQIGEGVLVLHESLDGQWVFVQGPNYNGWVHEEDIAFTSEADFRAFLTARDFAVAVRPGVQATVERPSQEAIQLTLRLGTVLPLKRFDESAITLVFPVRNEVGDLETQEITLVNNGAFSAGFLPYSADALLTVARSVIGWEYGWGDEKENYDCSSFSGLSYRCFGFYMPRNSSQQRYFGGTVTDVSGQDRASKYRFLEEHPGAVLAYPGHVMVYEKTEEGRHYILHANTVWYDGAGVFHEAYRVWEAPLEELARADGSLLLDAVRWIVTFP